MSRSGHHFALLACAHFSGTNTGMAGSIRFLLALGAVGGELSVPVVHALWRKLSPTARLAETYRRLLAAGRVETQRTGPVDKRILRLTAEGRRICAAGIDPEQQWARTWDGTWRIVAFDIPEKDATLRSRLRRKLHEHRFGWLQNSVWISPDPVDEFRALMSEKRLLPESLTFLEAKPSGGESNEAMVTSAWDFVALDKQHQQYLELLQLRPSRLQKPAAWLTWLETEYASWRELARRDPFLPLPLLPRFYRGRAIWLARQEAFAAFRSAIL